MTVQLLSIEATQPLRFREIGKGHSGYDAIVQPGEAMERAIAMVNEFGGPNAWSITAHAFAPDSGMNVRCICGAEYSLASSLRRHIAARTAA